MSSVAARALSRVGSSRALALFCALLRSFAPRRVFGCITLYKRKKDTRHDSLFFGAAARSRFASFPLLCQPLRKQWTSAFARGRASHRVSRRADLAIPIAAFALLCFALPYSSRSAHFARAQIAHNDSPRIGRSASAAAMEQRPKMRRWPGRRWADTRTNKMDAVGMNRAEEKQRSGRADDF